MSQNKQALAAQLKHELRQFTGDLDRYRHCINRRVIYTPGVKHLAEQAGAYWLIDVIASWIGGPTFNLAIQRDERIGSLHFWKLVVNSTDSSAVIAAVPDSGEAPFITQKVPHMDFPLESIDIWAGFDGQHWTLYLPSEH